MDFRFANDTGVIILTNAASLLLNRYIFTIIRFPPLGLSLIHYVVTFLLLLIDQVKSHQFLLFILSKFRPNRSTIVELTVLFCFSTVFNNVILAENPIVVCVIARNLVGNISEFFNPKFQGKLSETKNQFRITLRIYYLALDFVALIISLKNQLLTIRTVIILASVWLNAYYNICYQRSVRKLKISNDHLVCFETAVAQIILFAVMPFYDTMDFIQKVNWSWESKFVIILSSVFALYRMVALLNLSEKTTTAWRTTLIHLSQLLVVVLDLVFVSKNISFCQVTGLGLSELGSYLNSYFLSLSKRHKINYCL